MGDIKSAFFPVFAPVLLLSMIMVTPHRSRLAKLANGGIEATTLNCTGAGAFDSLTIRQTLQVGDTSASFAQPLSLTEATCSGSWTVGGDMDVTGCLASHTQYNGSDRITLNQTKTTIQNDAAVAGELGSQLHVDGIKA